LYLSLLINEIWSRSALAEVFKNIIKKSFGALGLVVHRRSTAAPAKPNAKLRDSLEGILRQAGSIGIDPATVIDVGAAFGYFTLECHGVFPRARYVLVEPLDEYNPSLQTLKEKIPNAIHVSAAAASRSEDIIINVHPDLVGSSLRLENEDSEVNGTPRAVPSITLDEIVKRYELQPPFFLKVDVQGAELDVLSGFENGLRDTEYVLLEVSFFNFFENGPTIFDVMGFMKSRGFVSYDIHGLQYRPLDNALSQIDLSFVKESGAFRKHHFYATRQQREEQFKVVLAG
jgi:FkbM family methyltransferase